MRVAVGHTGIEPGHGKKLGNPIATLGSVVDQAVRADRLTDDLTDRHARIERAVRILEYHLHARPQRAQFGVRHLNQVLPFKQNRSLTGTIELQDAATRGCLAATRFPHETQGFAKLNRKVDSVYGFDPAGNMLRDQSAVDREVLLQSAYLQQVGVEISSRDCLVRLRSHESPRSLCEPR